jgi:hypothetical protein
MDPVKAKEDFIARVEAYQKRYQTIEDFEDHSHIRSSSLPCLPSSLTDTGLQLHQAHQCWAKSDLQKLHRLPLFTGRLLSSKHSHWPTKVSAPPPPPSPLSDPLQHLPLPPCRELRFS